MAHRAYDMEKYRLIQQLVTSQELGLLQITYRANSSRSVRVCGTLNDCGSELPPGGTYFC